MTDTIFCPTCRFWLRMVYTTQLANYISALFFVILGPVFAHSRTHHKDYYIMIMHHVVTIALIGLSYYYSMYRVGSSVLLVHDVSDIFLELGKCFNYMNWETASNITFAIFAIVFFVSRLIIYPYHILSSVLFDSYRILGPDRPLGMVWDLLLGSLQVTFTAHSFSHAPSPTCFTQFTLCNSHLCIRVHLLYPCLLYPVSSSLLIFAFHYSLCIFIGSI